VKAVIIAVGDELISGACVDTNSAWLSRRLDAMGIDTAEHCTIGDSLEQVAAVISRAAAAGDVVLVSGGLGPTADDVTRQALAQAMGRRLVTDRRQLKRIEGRFRRRGWPMADINRVQATLPEGAEALDNDHGTAPGIAARIGSADVYLLPGVPSEMEKMFEERVAPRLPARPGAVRRAVLRTFGRGESDIATEISDLMQAAGSVTVGTTASAGEISVRVTSRADAPERAEALLTETVAEVRRRLGDLVFGEGDETPASACGKLLRARGETLATAESCTGGMLGEMITRVPGSSDYYVGGVLAYSNEVKRDALGVAAEVIDSHGAVSEQVAEAMAAGCRERFAVDWAVSITGVAGPGGGTEVKPVGLIYVALAGASGVDVRRHHFPGTRQLVRHRTANAALNYLRRTLLEK